MLLKKGHCIVANSVSVVIFLRLILIVILRRNELIVATKSSRIIKTTCTNNCAIKLFKTPLQRPITLGPLWSSMFGYMPLTTHVATISSDA